MKINLHLEIESSKTTTIKMNERARSSESHNGLIAAIVAAFPDIYARLFPEKKEESAKPASCPVCGLAFHVGRPCDSYKG